MRVRPAAVRRSTASRTSSRSRLRTQSVCMSHCGCQLNYSASHSHHSNCHHHHHACSQAQRKWTAAPSSETTPTHITHHLHTHPKQTQVQTQAQIPQLVDTIPTLPRLAYVLPAWIRGPALHPHEDHPTCNGPSLCCRWPGKPWALPEDALHHSPSNQHIHQSLAPAGDPVNAGSLCSLSPHFANLTCPSLMPATTITVRNCQSPSAQHQVLQSHSLIALSASSVACSPARPCVSASLRAPFGFRQPRPSGATSFELLTGIPPGRRWAMSLAASDSVQRSIVSCYLGSNVSGQSSGPLDSRQ